jgi:hypothetical protein
MVHAALITAHAASGIIAFAAGCAAIWRRRAFRVYLWSLVALVALAAAAVAADWPGLGTGSRVVFAALTALGGYLIWRAALARRLLPAGPGRPPTRYLDHLGFTLIALFDGFAVIAVLSAGGPGWLAAAAGVAGVAAGRVAIGRLKARIAAAGDAAPTGGPPARTGAGGRR